MSGRSRVRRARRGSPGSRGRTTTAPAASRRPWAATCACGPTTNGRTVSRSSRRCTRGRGPTWSARPLPCRGRGRPLMAPTSVLWLLELMGSAGQRAPLVDAAVASGLMDAETGELMKRDVERPGWADGEVPWTLDDVVIVGDVHLPGGRLGGGDPFLI